MLMSARQIGQPLPNCSRRVACCTRLSRIDVSCAMWHDLSVRLRRCLITCTTHSFQHYYQRIRELRWLCYVSLPIHVMFPCLPVLHFLPLRICFCVFQSCLFHPCDLVPCFPVLRFPFPCFQSSRRRRRSSSLTTPIRHSTSFGCILQFGQL